MIPPLTAVPNIFIDPGCESSGRRHSRHRWPAAMSVPLHAVPEPGRPSRGLQLYGELNTQLGDVRRPARRGLLLRRTTFPKRTPRRAFRRRRDRARRRRCAWGLPVDPTNSPTFIVPLNNPGLAGAVALAHARASECDHGRARCRGQRPAVPSARPGGNPLFENEGVQREIFADAFRFSAALDGEVANVGWNVAVTYAENHRRIRAPDILAANLQLALAGFGGANCTGNIPGAPMAASSSIRSRPALRRTS